MDDPLVDTWAIHDRINLCLLDAVPEDALGASLPKYRTVHDHFAHMHNVRLLWLKTASSELLEGLEKVETKTVTSKAHLASALEASGKAVAELIRLAIADGGKIKGFKPQVRAFVGYLIAHESHHRGQVAWTLKQTGHTLSQKATFGLWE